MTPAPTNLVTWCAAAKRGAPADSIRLESLSPREREVFEYIVRGCAIAELAAMLGISTHTVRQHRKSIYQVLGVHSQVELMRHYGTAVSKPEVAHG
jgi:DNA-binding CsgD family transcriptional regulator